MVAVQAAMDPYTSAILTRKNPVRYPEIVQALAYYQNQIQNLTMAPFTSMETPSSQGDPK
jgi:hypothetical protein